MSRRMLRDTPTHPFLLALYPVMAMLAANVSQALPSDTLRSFAAALALALILLLAFRALLKDWSKAAALASLALALFFTYGHVYGLLQGFAPGGVRIGRTALLLPLWGLAFLGGAWWAFRHKGRFGGTGALNLLALALLVLPFYTVVSYHVQAALARREQRIEPPAALAPLAARFSGRLPDVYYIVLDMHAGSEVLKAFYGYDNGWFMQGLRERGFYIAGESTSNYSSTLQSLASALNMEYVNYLQAEYGADSNNREPLGLLLEENRVFQLFRQVGYDIGSFQTNDFYTEFKDVEHYLKPSPQEVRQYQNPWSLNPFEGLLVQSTALRVLFDAGLAEEQIVQQKTLETPYDLHRLTVTYALEHLPDFARMEGNHFVFAHIVSPHPPYVFDRDGGRLTHDEPFSLSAPGRLNDEPGIVEAYAGQTEYIDRRVLEAIDLILSSSDTPPIIILQGDHGPVSYAGEGEVEKSNMWEQHSILNAYLFPDGDTSGLYPAITPVNSFRVLFNTYFGGNYELLPDENYFLQHARPYDFLDVTERVRTDPRSP